MSSLQRKMLWHDVWKFSNNSLQRRRRQMPRQGFCDMACWTHSFPQLRAQLDSTTQPSDTDLIAALRLTIARLEAENARLKHFRPRTVPRLSDNRFVHSHRGHPVWL